MNAPPAPLGARFADFVTRRDYPCVMAASSARLGQADVLALGPLGPLPSPDLVAGLGASLRAFGEAPAPDKGYRSCVAVFADPPPAGEPAFERALWALLGALHASDDGPWDPAVSSDPGSPEFSFSFAGRAYYVVGMHPGASRPARRFPHAALVFNLHAQFEALRADGRYDRVRDLIRARDVAFAGDVNPSLSDHGTESEARQYSGRAAGPDWRCPFHPAPDG